MNSRSPWATPTIIGLATVSIASAGLALSGETSAMLAWWMSIGLLLPPLVWAIRSRYVTPITVCALAFSTQFVTLPFFYTDRANFAFANVKPFGFTAAEAAPMLGKVALFLVSLLAFFELGCRVTVREGSCPSILRITPEGLRGRRKPRSQAGDSHVSQSSASVGYTLLIALIIAALIPLNLWMFSQGISIVGVEPPRLPFHLSGVLHYATHYLSPLVLGYLYWKTRRRGLPALLLLLYAVVLGLCSTSRSALTYVMLPVIAFAWLDRRRATLVLATIATVLGFALVTAERSLVELVTAGMSGAVTDTGVGTLAMNILSSQSGFLNANVVFEQLVGMFDRLDGFRNLVMAQYYDPRAVVGALGFVLRMIYRPLAPMDADQHHLQWLGFVPAEGFANGGALLSNAVIVGNEGMGWVVLSGAVTALTLVVLERCTARFLIRYQLPELLGIGFLGFMTLNYFIETGGSSTFVMPFLAVAALSALSFLVPKSGPGFEPEPRLNAGGKRLSQIVSRTTEGAPQ